MSVDTLAPQGLEFWGRLSAFINNNPVQEKDRFYMAMLKPLGIEKGKPFAPNDRQKAILEEAARIGDAMGRVMLYNGHERFEDRKLNTFAGTYWYLSQPLDPTHELEYSSQLDERLHYTYGAIYTSPGIGALKAGPGSSYTQTFKDKDGNHLDGAKTYKLHVPANPPAESFWSFTIYDTATRSMLQNGGDPAISSYDKFKTNPDGSVDLYFGPKVPASVDPANFRPTVPGKRWYPMVRFYSPTAGLFDGTWKLPDIEKVK